MIKIYTSKNCAWCSRMKKYLDSKGSEYEEYDVADPKNAEEAYRLSGQRAVPITVIGNSIIVGFDRDAVDELLG